MRGNIYFSQPDEAEWVRVYDRSYARWSDTQARNGRDFGGSPTTEVEWNAIYDTICNENDYRAWRRNRDRELEGERVFWKGVSPIDLDGLPEVPFDRPRLQPFRLKYDTLEEVRMRFNKTVIIVKGHPFFVADQRNINGQFYLLLENEDNSKGYIQIDDIPDLRPPPACYVKMGESNGYFKRLPARVNQQGLTNASCIIRHVGRPEHIGFSNAELVKALSSRGKKLPWQQAFRTLIDDQIVNTFRLSDTLALYKKPAKKAVLVEYKGRRLGELIDHSIKVFDEDDVIQPWLKRDAQQVNLEIST